MSYSQILAVNLNFLFSLCCHHDALYLLTASHLPFNRNGFKFFTNAGGLGKANIKDILERASMIYDRLSVESSKTLEQAAASVKRVDYMRVYTSDLVNAVRKAAGNIGEAFFKFIICIYCLIILSPTFI